MFAVCDVTIEIVFWAIATNRLISMLFFFFFFFFLLPFHRIRFKRLNMLVCLYFFKVCFLLLLLFWFSSRIFRLVHFRLFVVFFISITLLHLFIIHFHFKNCFILWLFHGLVKESMQLWILYDLFCHGTSIMYVFLVFSFVRRF